MSTQLKDGCPTHKLVATGSGKHGEMRVERNGPTSLPSRRMPLESLERLQDAVRARWRARGIRLWRRDVPDVHAAVARAGEDVARVWGPCHFVAARSCDVG